MVKWQKLSFLYLIGVIMRIEPRIVTVNKEMDCLGLKTRTTVKTVYQDLPKLYDRYMDAFRKNLITNVKRPWEYISLSQNYDKDFSWDYYTGHVITKYGEIYGDLVKFSVPKGDYAVFEVRCKREMFFGIKVGMIKKYIYTKWLPGSGYEFAGYEYEYSNEDMKKKGSHNVDLFVGIKRKQLS